MSNDAVTPSERVFLVGPMGAGKTTIGRQLARRLGLDFVDSDQAIEERTGVDIPTIFDIEGEAGFRQRETKMIDELTARPRVVVSTGGGAVLAEDNRRRLVARGTVIYLRTNIDTQLARARNGRRPLLDVDNPRERLESLFTERDPLYREVADHIIDTDGGGVERIVTRILERLHED